MNFLELLTFRGIRWRRGAKPGEINICCPFCAEDRFRLGLNFIRNKAHCFNCDWKSRRAVSNYLRKINLGDIQLNDAPDDQEDLPKTEKLDLPEGFYLLSETSKADGEPWYTPRKYLLRRGITKDQIKKHFFGATLQSRFAYRIILPVHYKQELKMIVARDWTGNREPKYLNSTGEKSLWNIAKKEKGQTLYLAEGIFKSLAIEKVRPAARSASLLGHAITEAQLEQLHECRFRSAVIVSDPDRAGIKGTVMVANRLNEAGIQVQLIYPIPTKQADEYTPEELSKVLENVQPYNVSIENRLRIAAQ